MSITMTSETLKKNIPYIYDSLYMTNGERIFKVKIERVNENTFIFKQSPYAKQHIYKNEFPSNCARILPVHAAYLNKKFK